MRRILVLVVGLVAALALVPGQAVAAKKCRKGQAVAVVGGKAKCVKKCPPGQVKRKAGKTVKCVRAKKPAPPDPDPNPDNVDPNPNPDPEPTPPAPAFDPLAKFTEVLGRIYLLRNYTVQNGNQTNTHSDQYEWCTLDGRRIMGREFESLSYIYKDYGPYEILQGEASEDGSTGSGVLRYTKEWSNFQEEVGRVLEIQISWQGDTATVINPESYSTPYQYAKSLRAAEGCS
jgi:hypothetical protein